jgi:hypothetical protein
VLSQATALLASKVYLEGPMQSHPWSPYQQCASLPGCTLLANAFIDFSQP